MLRLRINCDKSSYVIRTHLDSLSYIIYELMEMEVIRNQSITPLLSMPTRNSLQWSHHLGRRRNTGPLFTVDKSGCYGDQRWRRLIWFTIMLSSLILSCRLHFISYTKFAPRSCIWESPYGLLGVQEIPNFYCYKTNRWGRNPVYICCRRTGTCSNSVLSSIKMTDAWNLKL